MNPFLSQPEITELVNALVNSQVDTTASRPFLLQSINRTYSAMLPVGLPPRVQLLNDIGQMNTVERLVNGQIPLAIYLQNAATLLSGLAEERVILEALDKVNIRSTGAPQLDPTQLPEIQEAIVHTDDMVTFGFMQAGVRAASAVMKLMVPRFENGQVRQTTNGTPVQYLGTGWLLTESLVMTNHHVINARNEGEANAPEADLHSQAKGTLTLMDYDADNLQGTQSNSIELVASHPDLDYAILRIPPATGRIPLPRAVRTVEKGDPVNIIQHPNGNSKRFAIRNNLVSATSDTFIRYFTDTNLGSSGSPVFNDQWQVVALHRSSITVSGVQFQGKQIAHVNQGTQLSAIVADLRVRHPAIAAEIGHFA